jgi:hypothetical protein
MSALLSLVVPIIPHLIASVPHPLTVSLICPGRWQDLTGFFQKIDHKYIKSIYTGR